MQRVATFTRLHGNGNNIEVIMNGFVNKEIMRQRELERKEMNRMEQRHNKHLKEKLAALNAKPCKENKFKDKFTFVLACIICWAEQLGLIKYEKEEQK